MKKHLLNNRITPSSVFLHEITEVIFSAQSKFQEIAVMDSPDFGRILVLDGVVNLTEADEFIYHEMLVHVPLFSHARPETVLIVGGGDGCTAREVLKHRSVRRVVQVELDPMVMEVSKKYLGRLNNYPPDPRLEIFCCDAIEYMAQTRDTFDAILMDTTDASIDNSRPLFSEKYYADCRKALTEKGVLSAQVGDGFFEPQVVAPVFSRLREKKLFPLSRMYLAPVPAYAPFPYCLAFCTKDPDVAFSPARVPDIPGLRYYTAKIHEAAFVLPPFIKDKFFTKDPEP